MGFSSSLCFPSFPAGQIEHGPRVWNGSRQAFFGVLMFLGTFRTRNVGLLILEIRL